MIHTKFEGIFVISIHNSISIIIVVHYLSLLSRNLHIDFARPPCCIFTSYKGITYAKPLRIFKTHHQIKFQPHTLTGILLLPQLIISHIQHAHFIDGLKI